LEKTWLPDAEGEGLTKTQGSNNVARVMPRDLSGKENNQKKIEVQTPQDSPPAEYVAGEQRRDKVAKTDKS